MENQKENIFLEKFRLLNSQEHTSEISWSHSSVSDYEDVCNENTKNNLCSKARKKRKRKKKAPKNMSNLSVTILDTSAERRNANRKEKSPILGCGIRQKKTSISPILKSSQPPKQVCTITSPILTSKTMRLKSPILVSRTNSPKSSFNIRKKLFDIGNFEQNIGHTENLHELTKGIISNTPLLKENEKKLSDITTQNSDIEEIFENNLINENVSKAKLDLAKRVKSFFDSHFSSENTSVSSQNSISDILTPKNSTKSSDEVEIFTCKSQAVSNNNSLQLDQEKSVNSSKSSIYDFNKNSKKTKYKKNGLAYRLNSLLKKQKASLSLWQHERYLASNSNFVIPKGEFTVFRIQNVNFKYGCHIIEAVDTENEKYLILINSLYVTNSIASETVLKLYTPFRVLQFNNDFKLIINVDKYECNNFRPIS